MKHNTSQMIKRTNRLPVVLIGEGLLVGAVGGGVVLGYRIALVYAGAWMQQAVRWAKGSGLRMAVWFAALAALAVLVSWLVRWEPMISGSGIPQLEGEMGGKLAQRWFRVLPAKFAGGFLCLLGGLSLGREGPSIQLGAMTGKGIAKALKRDKTEEKLLLTCGAGAGLAAAFHAPLAGVMFALEEVHKNFSVSVLVSVMTASLTADYLASQFIGIEPVFQFDIGHVLPQKDYWMLLLLGLLLGVFGAFYNWFTLSVQSLYRKLKGVGTTGKLLIPFLTAGVLAFTVPELLGSGHNLIDLMTDHKLVLGTALALLAGKFVFSAVCFGSGAPGGIFFPLLVIGALTGGSFGLFGVQYFGLDMDYVNNFVLLAMAGYFTAIVRAPLTGILLIFEMTGSVSQMLSLSIVSIAAYIAAAFLKSEPIYESLLERLLLFGGTQMPEHPGEKVLFRQAVPMGAALEDRTLEEVHLPERCLIVAVHRGSEEIIPNGQTVLRAGDELICMTDEAHEGAVHDAVAALCEEIV